MLGWNWFSCQNTYFWFVLPHTLSTLPHPFLPPQVSSLWASLPSSFRLDSSTGVNTLRREGERSMQSGDIFLPADGSVMCWLCSLEKDGHSSWQAAFPSAWASVSQGPRSTLSSYPFGSRCDVGALLALAPEGCTKAWGFPTPHLHLCQ